MDDTGTNPTPLTSAEADRMVAAGSGPETRPVAAAGYGPPERTDVWNAANSGPRFSQDSYMPRQRPTGVTVIAVLNFIGAALIGFIFVTALAANVDLGFAAIILPLDVVFAIAVGIGLLQLKNWARTLAFIGYGINIVIDIFGSLTGPITGSTLLNLAIAGIIIWYLRQPQVAEVFE